MRSADTNPNRAPRAVNASRGRRGATLVEAIVGLVVLTIGMVGVAGGITQSARRGAQAAVQSGRLSAKILMTDRLATVSFDSIPAKVGCSTITTNTFPHTRCVSYSDSTGGAGYRVVRLIITPTNTRVRAETSLVIRTRGIPVSPL